MSQWDIPSSADDSARIDAEVESATKIVAENSKRVAKLGEWPAYIPPESIVKRIPVEGQTNADGFDAGIACALNLIPADKQELAARLHANYSKDAVLKIRQEVAEHNHDSETTWWLAASLVCEEGGVDRAKFLQQIDNFKKMASDPVARGEAAKEEFAQMTSSFELKDGVPFGTKDGCIQGAYIAGYPFGTRLSEDIGLYFIGTYENSLGLEDFVWSDEKDEQGRGKSGPVHGSKQFVKCSSEEEWKRAMEVVKAKLLFEVKE